ncbi:MULTISPECIES: protein YgfX [unclassified Shewanella]|uniref:protein YgfX n=1 Tax=unclassified Shewanella TaxID=196818 RepID=UPI001C7CB5AC|nr:MULTISPECIES: protein YgfX [unclassified Shewanella]
MDVQQHSFDLTSSNGQRLSLTVVALICLSSFLIWPYAENTLYILLKSLLFCACSGFFIWQLYRLKYWQCQFVLKADGAGRFKDGRDFVIQGKPVITPFAVMFDITIMGGKKRLVLWADMLDDTNYRHLCRLLQLAYQS